MKCIGCGLPVDEYGDLDIGLCAECNDAVTRLETQTPRPLRRDTGSLDGQLTNVDAIRDEIEAWSVGL